MDQSTIITPSPEAVANHVGGETVILHLGNGTYYGLDSLGTRVWELLQGGTTLRLLSHTMKEEYDVSVEVLEADLEIFLQKLVSQELVTET